MTWKTQLIEQLKKHEGLRIKPYLCTAGIPTIGYGNITYPDGRKVTLQDTPITQVKAEEMLIGYVEKFIYPVIEKIFPTFLSFTDNRKVAVCDMLYNLGEKRLRGFKKMITAINSSNWDLAIKEAMDSAWYKQVGNRSKTILMQFKG